MNYKVITGNNIDILKAYPDNHFDSIVTDPPYGIEFLGKDWDSNTGAIETWQECLRVLKPGGYLLAFSAARTYHHLATNIESVGFEIRDQIMWIYGSGFPKAQDLGKAIDKRNNKKGKKGPAKRGAERLIRATDENGNRDNSNGVWANEVNRDPYTYVADNEWAGWKTALKPAHEPIVMARKPFKGSCVDNVLAHGVGALNIDATRIGSEEMPIGAHEQTPSLFASNKKSAFAEETIQGRFPSNVIGEISDDYQKYFYCPKVSRAERHTGFEDPGAEKILPIGSTHPDDIKKHPLWDPSIGGDAQRLKAKILEHTPKQLQGNNHPTVKPVDLMRYLITLVTPSGGHVLDPFNGSGSTGMAAVEMGYEYTGCELDPAYADIARKRIEAWYRKTDISGHELPTEWFDEVN